jgi:uncharacterized delta-60 repeat protein
MSSGDLDTTFNSPEGYLTKQFFSGYSTVGTSLALDSSGNIYVTGFADYAKGAAEQEDKSYMFLAKYSKDGVLYSGFGDNGTGYVLKQFISDDYSSAGYSLALDSSGNIYVTGNVRVLGTDSSMFLAKYSRDGVLYSGFGDNGTGYVIEKFISDDYSSIVRSLALDSSGNIYVTGNVYVTDYSMFLAKYSKEGVLYSGFGDNGTGYVIENFYSGYGTFGNSVILDSSGSIYVTCTSVKSNDGSGYMVLSKYDISGVLDTNFANGTGYASKSLTNIGTVINSVDSFTSKIDSSGNIYVTGTIRDNNTDDTLNASLFLAKYTKSGVLDTAFGGSGTGFISKQFSPGHSLIGGSIALDTSENIYVTGSGYFKVENYDFYSRNIFIAKYTKNGVLDTSFGGVGYINENFSNIFSAGFSIALDISGNIYVTGYTNLSNSNFSSMLLAKFIGSNNEPICVPKGTPILTDQGLLPIEQIDTNKHTISNRPIVAITQTITPEKSLVCFEKNSLGINCPTKRTLMTPGHCVAYKGKLVQSKEFVGRIEGVYTVPYNGKDILYNVLMNGHSLMNVNGMILETLHPENKVAKNILTIKYQS